MRSAYLLDLPPIAYNTALELQRAVVAARVRQDLDRDVIFILEHAPVFTLGRRGGRENLYVTDTFLQERGIDVVPIERGGNITYHGPGQLVAYPVIALNSARIRVVEFVDSLEEVMIRTAAYFGVQVQGGKDLRGVWIQKRKLGSVGITVRRGVSFHGLALNVNTDLEPFSWINPCGIKGCEMTTLVREVGRPVCMQAVRQQMALHLSELFKLDLEMVDKEVLESKIGKKLKIRN